MRAEYINHMGDDLTVVNAARVSFDKESEWAIIHTGRGPSSKVRQVIDPKDARLIKYLATHGHWTPFAHPQITMRETVPIFVARQRFKHMVGFAYNEVSRRYVDDDPEFFAPDAWRVRPEGSVKQGSGAAHPDQALIQAKVNSAQLRAWECYHYLLGQGVAPEQARMTLPQSMMTSYYVTGSLAAWARAYKQRIDAHAQVEIQQLARQWGDIIAPLYPASWVALTEGSL